MHRIGIDARGDAGAREADGASRALMAATLAGVIVMRPALVQLALLEVGEDRRCGRERRAAEAGAVLRLGQRQLGVRERIGRVEPLVAEEAVEVAVQVLVPLLVTTLM